MGPGRGRCWETGYLSFAVSCLMSGTQYFIHQGNSLSLLPGQLSLLSIIPLMKT